MTAIATYLDRPVAFQRAFVQLGTGITGALMLSQAVYWSNRISDDTGWFYKTQSEWEDETGLTRREQEGARARLMGIGVLIEERRGVPAQLYFRVDFDALEAILGTHQTANLDCTKPPIKNARNRQTSMAKTAKQVRTKAPNKSAPNRQSNIRKTTTETTTETTHIAEGADATPAPMLVTDSQGTVHEIPGDLRYPGPQTKSHKTWVAYAITYHHRYKAWPIWNGSVAGKLTNFIDRVGVELAPRTAAWFVLKVNEQSAIKEMHSIGLLLAQAEKWATQAKTGRGMTQTAAAQADQTAANADAIEQAAGMAIQMVHGGQPNA